MPFVIEDGSGVAGANTYAPLTAIRAYNEQRGVVLPDDNDECAALAVLAFDCIEMFEPRFKGERSLPLIQTASWPRKCVEVYGQVIASLTIPYQLIAAQCYLTGVATTIDLMPVTSSSAVTKEVIGPIETDYDVKFGASLGPIMPHLDSLLVPLCKPNAGILRVARM